MTDITFTVTVKDAVGGQHLVKVQSFLATATGPVLEAESQVVVDVPVVSAPVTSVQLGTPVLS